MTFETTSRLAEIRQDELLQFASHHHFARGRRRGLRFPRPTRATRTTGPTSHGDA